MANWLASRCDNTSETYVVDLRGKFSGETGMVILGSDGLSSKVCLTLIEETLDLATLIIDGGPYGNCLECFNKTLFTILFTNCFGGTDLIMDSSGLKFVPQVGMVYNMDVTIDDGKVTTNLKDCFTYGGLSGSLPSKIKINDAPTEYDTCELCNPYKGKLADWESNVSSSEKFTNLRTNYTNIV
jgi:hypothetical protein